MDTLVVHHPRDQDVLLDPSNASRVAFWFWHSHIVLLRKTQFTRTTKVVMIPEMLLTFLSIQQCGRIAVRVKELLTRE